MEKFSDEITYTPTVSNHSSYVMRNVAPQGSNSATLTTSGVVGPVEFILPPSVFNLSKSKLQFTLNIGVAGATPNFNFINANLLTTINRIVLYSTATNAVLADVSSFNLFTSATLSPSTKLDKYLCKPFLNGAAPLTDALSRLRTVEEIQKSNAGAGGAVTINDSPNNIDLAPYNPYLGRRQWIIGADAAATSVDVSIPMESIKHTVLSLDKNLYFPENMVLQIYFNATDNFCFYSGANTTPLSTATSASSATVTNLNINLAQENNLAIVSQTIDRVMKGPGISLPFTYPSVTRTSITGTSPSYQLSLTKAYGQRILGILTAPFSAVSKTGANWHYKNNTVSSPPALADTILSSYNTFLNSVAIKQQAGFDGLKSQDYIANKPYLDGSVIQTIDEYALVDWFHFDSFVGEKPLYELDENQTDLDGMDVSNASSTWQFQGTLSTSTNLTYCSIILGQKILSITSSGAMVM
jgi:hypothetical protein